LCGNAGWRPQPGCGTRRASWSAYAGTRWRSALSSLWSGDSVVHRKWRSLNVKKTLSLWWKWCLKLGTSICTVTNAIYRYTKVKVVAVFIEESCQEITWGRSRGAASMALGEDVSSASRPSS
jgi:hypothetical protein